MNVNDPDELGQELTDITERIDEIEALRREYHRKRLDLMRYAVEQAGWTRTAVGETIGCTQPRVSQLLNANK